MIEQIRKAEGVVGCAIVRVQSAAERRNPDDVSWLRVEP